MAEFDWWLLLVGVVVGAALTWLVLAESGRHDRDVDESETAAEAAWIAGALRADGRSLEAADAEAVLRAHRRYLGFPPPDELVDPAVLDRDTAPSPPESPVPPADDEVDALDREPGDAGSRVPQRRA